MVLSTGCDMKQPQQRQKRPSKILRKDKWFPDRNFTRPQRRSLTHSSETSGGHTNRYRYIQIPIFQMKACKIIGHQSLVCCDLIPPSEMSVFLIIYWLTFRLFIGHVAVKFTRYSTASCTWLSLFSLASAINSQISPKMRKFFFDLSAYLTRKMAAR
jgi:hypothetical protein